VSNELQTNLRHLENASIVDLLGDVTATSDAILTTAYTAATDSGKLIVLNFEEASYINSAGIAIILSLLNRARTNGRRVVLTSLSSHYQKIFHMVGLDQFATIYESEQAALSAAV